jgi:hypothetical protein
MKRQETIETLGAICWHVDMLSLRLPHSESSCFITQNSHCCIMCPVIHVWGVYLSWKCWNNMLRWFQIWCNVNFFYKNLKLYSLYHTEVDIVCCIVGFFFCIWYAEKLTKMSSADLVSVFLLHEETLCHYRFYTHVWFLWLLSSVMVLTCGYQWGGSTYGVGWGPVQHGTVLSIVKKCWQDESFKLYIDEELDKTQKSINLSL